mgnify:CR=1 FL=1
MRFKLDENIHPEVAELLRQHGHDALTVWDQSMRGRPDADLAKVCQNEGRVLVTLDLDFADIRAYPPAQYLGLMVLRLHRQDRAYVRAVFAKLLPQLKPEAVERRLWIVEEAGVRIRG